MCVSLLLPNGKNYMCFSKQGNNMSIFQRKQEYLGGWPFGRGGGGLGGTET